MAKEKIKSSLKHPVLKNVEYFDLIKNKQTVKAFDSNEVENITWRDLQTKIGSLFGDGLFNYQFKLKNSDVLYRGTIRSVNKITKSDNPGNFNFSKDIQDLKNQVATLSQGSQQIGIDMLLSITKQSYEMQITFLNAQLANKDIDLNKYQIKIDKLEDELTKCYEQIDTLNSEGGLNKYFEIAQTFLKLKNPGNVAKVSLKDSDSTDIPKDILDLLGLVDWSKVDPNILDQIINYLNMFIPKLPQKGN